MNVSSATEAARQSLGPVGAYLPPGTAGLDLATGVRQLEHLAPAVLRAA